MAVHFISDLHLQPRQTDMAAILQRYLAGPARTAEALYILGDLFEYWIGDDASLAEHAATVAALRGLADAGVPILFMHGNRDFAAGTDFAAAAGITLLRDPTVIDLNGTRAALTHGDRLCTNDIEHQRFRARYTDPAWRARMLALPICIRRAVARYARLHSRLSVAEKSERVMDVSASTVSAFMREQDVPLLIHGHTHRPADHRFQLDGRPAQRLVLSDWHDRAGEVLIHDRNRWYRQALH